MDPVNLLQWGICKICKLSFASFDMSSFLKKCNSSAKVHFVVQGAAAHVRGAAEDDATAGGEQHAAAAAAELQQQQCPAAAEAADFQQQLKHAPRAKFQHAPGAELKHADAAGDQDDQEGSSGSLDPRCF